MAVLLRCPRCGAALDSGRVGGICPACLMAVAADRNEETTSPNEPAAIGLAAAGIDVLAPSLPPAKPGHGPWSEPPEQIGVYRVLEKIAEGGMGVVYKAEQRGPVRRVVALKLVKPGMYSS